MLVRIALSALAGSRPIANEWPLPSGDHILAFDTVGNQAAVWVAIDHQGARTTAAIVSLDRDSEGWLPKSVDRQDSFFARTPTRRDSPLYGWSSKVSFRERSLEGMAMVWGRALPTTLQVGIGYGFSEPRLKSLDRGTGYFLVVEPIDRIQAETLCDFMDLGIESPEPILRVWSSDGRVVDLSLGS